MDRFFFSRNNFNVIYNIIGENIYENYSFDISTDNKYENEIINNMNEIYNKRQKFNINYNISPQNSSNELSKLVLKKSVKEISQDIKNIKSKNKVDIRPKPSSTNTMDVNKRYEQLQNERSSLINKEPKNIPKFNDNLDINYKDVNSEYEKISKTRENIENIENFEENLIKSREMINTIKIQQPLEENYKDVNREYDKTTEKIENVQDYSIQENYKDVNSEYEKLSKSREMLDNIQDYPIQENYKDVNVEYQQLSNDIEGPNSNNIFDSQFSILSDSVNKESDQKSLEERLSEYEKNRNIDLNINQSDKNENNLENDNNNLDDFFKIEASNIEDYNHPNLVKNKIINVENKQLFYITKKINIVINSIDRQWWGKINDDNEIYPSLYEDRYKYNVNVAPVSDTSVRVPIYENNKYIPPKLDVLNSNGFIWKKKNYPPYDNNKSNGLVLDYTTRVFKGGNDAVSIDRIIRNVKSVKLRRLIMPNDDLSESFHITNNPISQLHSDGLEDGNTFTPVQPEPKYTNYFNGFKQDPYLFIHMDGFNSNIISTNNFNKSLFAKPHFDKDYRYRPSENSCSYISRGWSYFKNDDGDYTEFCPAPLSELTKLSIEILRPDGSLYSSQKDNLLVSCIEFYNGVNNVDQPYPFLKITLDGGDNNGWVKDNYFNNGDKIIIKELKFLDNLSWPESWKCKISNYLECGANVIRWNDDSEELGITCNRFLRQILVPNPLITMNNNILEWNETLYSPSIYSDPNIPTKIDIKGFLINYNLQHSIVLELEIEQTKNQIVSEII